MATELGVAYLSLLPEMKSFRPAAEKGMDKVGRGVATRFGVGFNGAIGGIVSKSAGIFAAGFAGVKLGGFLKDAIGQASDLGETTSKVTQIFGPAAKDILKFSKNSGKALGQTQQAALDANATFGIFGKAAGLQGKNLSGFTTNLTTLASDLASFNNTTPEQAIEAIGAALRGETEPMRAYGVLLDDASLRQEALKQGLIKTTKQALTPQQKVLAAQALIMKQTTTAQGDFARTSGGLANQQRILSARFSDFKTTIGAVALPLATRFFGFLNDKAIPAVQGLWARVSGFVGSKGFQNFLGEVESKARSAFGFFKAEVLPRLGEFAGFIKGTVVPAVGNLIAAITPLARDVGSAAVGVFQKLTPVAQQLGGFITGTLVPAFVSFTGWLKQNSTVIGAVAVGVGAAVAAFNLYKITMAAVTGVSNVFKAAQLALNFVMSLNPLGIVILALVALAAGLVYAYKKSETFRNIVNGVFNAVKTTAITVFDAVKGAVTTAIEWIKSSFTSAKNWVTNAFSKSWNAIKTVITTPIDAAKRAIDTILGAGKGGVQWIFSQAVSAIGTIWSGLQELTKKPIRFIVNTVLNDGLIGAFNWVAGKFGSEGIGRIALPAGFARGGQFDGQLPGRPSRRDNMLGMTAAGPVGLATGEYIVNARDTARALPFLEHVNNGGALPGFAKGGLFGKLKNAVTGAFSAGKSFGQDVLGFLSDPVKWFKDRMTGPLDRMSELGSSPMGEVLKSVPRKLVDTVASKAKDLLTGTGSVFNGGLSGALQWARSQAGKPYLWGGVGPLGYDCSGFLSAIVNVAQGRDPHQRRFATGSLPGGLFAPGKGAFEIGWFTGNPGHTAGTVNGVNVESRGGRGVIVGAGARGASDSLFNSGIFHLQGFAKGGKVGDGPFDLLNPRGKHYLGEDYARQILPKALSFDSGGMLPTGYSMVHNGTGKPEPVGHDVLRMSDLNGLRIELDAGDVTFTGHIRTTAQGVVNESNRQIKRRVGH
jgi:gas vesicle protein